LGALAFRLGWERLLTGLDLQRASVSELRLRTENHPTDARIPTELARRCLLEQRYADAGRELDRALRLEPDFAAALYLRGLLQIFQEDAGGAVASFERLLRIRPDYAPARLRLGILQIQRSDFKGAITTLKEYLRQEPRDDAGYYWLGVAAF